MRKGVWLILMIFVLTGCRAASSNSYRAADWVDFIQWDGVKYHALYSGVLADKAYAGESVGKVKFKAAGSAADSNYKIKNGDAAFLKKGTRLYAVKGSPDLLAVKDKQAANGYKLYFSTENKEYKWHFENVTIERVNKIEIYERQGDTQKKIEELTGQDVKPLLELFTTSEEIDHFEPKTTKRNVGDYEVILYTDEPVAYRYALHFDGETYFWHPKETAVLSNEIAVFLHQK